jgi:23S rRNA pseudouridine2605 synthase
MRLNKYIAFHTGSSRRYVDQLIKDSKVQVNDHPASLGQDVDEYDKIIVNGLQISTKTKTVIIIMNKPVGYICSRNGQGSKTIYDLLPPELHNLKPVGRLDKDSSGLLLLTNNGDLANKLTHPSHQKTKIYEIELDQSLSAEDKIKIERGIKLEDGMSKLNLKGAQEKWEVIMYEGRNRQIRRTFAALGYKVTKLHRTHFAQYKINDLQIGKWKNI